MASGEDLDGWQADPGRCRPVVPADRCAGTMGHGSARAVGTARRTAGHQSRRCNSTKSGAASAAPDDSWRGGLQPNTEATCCRQKSGVGSSVVNQLCVAFLACAVGAAEELAVCLEAMPQDPTLTVLAGRSEPLGGALKAVEDVNNPCRTHLECLLVVIATDFTYRHGRLLLALCRASLLDVTRLCPASPQRKATSGMGLRDHPPGRGSRTTAQHRLLPAWERVTSVALQWARSLNACPTWSSRVMGCSVVFRRVPLDAPLGTPVPTPANPPPGLTPDHHSSLQLSKPTAVRNPCEAPPQF